MSWRGELVVLPLPREGPGQGQGALLDLSRTPGVPRLRRRGCRDRRDLGRDVGQGTAEDAGEGVGPNGRRLDLRRQKGEKR
jgi:hypothetical protein